ncbi:caspase family protein [Stenomitos frigidus]|uniref:Peptidase C14 n=1 Tax=Stenomitos frigidus ULC18 TaxID=2107698 RepID=A0A2T1EBE7_9CYAN|nr:caspase family protein [Stenomitos frigidus]PSB30034.1 peptidase C14 [Stenomitos frigidus ULC18]
MKRRDFLQRSGLTLALWGADDLLLSPSAQQYQQVLAAPTQRRLALLIGINQYHQAPLSGCVTDVALQRELLIHRFGFQASDILTLTDQQATREAIVTAFVEHLIEQARSGDVVVFHFSGYGGRVALGATPETVQNSLVAVDDPVMQGEVPIVQDLLADTLLLLLRSLPTDRVTTILDASYTPSEQPLQGNLRLRSRPGFSSVRPSEAELVLQESLLSQTNFDRARLAAQRRSGQMPGVVLSAVGIDQLATEAKWSGFSAGLFTYALTQQLWQATPATALRISLRRATEQVEQLANQVQQPQLSGQKSQERPLTPYHVTPVPLWGADGVVVGLEDGGAAQVWLGGLAAAVLEQYEANSVLRLVDDPATPDRPSTLPIQLQILSRDGLMAKAKLYSATGAVPALQVGQFVREQVRVLPRNVGLTIALDSSLARIERVDAISAISAVPRVSAAIAGKHAADYLFSKTQDVQPTQIAALPTTSLPDILTNKATSQGSYALFSPGRSTIPHTAGEGGEAVKVAVKRLVPKLQALLATKLLNLTVNDGSSQLAVRATLIVLSPQERSLLLRETPAIAKRVPIPKTLPLLLSPETAALISLPIGSHIQYQLDNQSDVALYFLVLHLDSNGDLIALRSPLLRPTSSASAPLLPDSPSASDRTRNTIEPRETLTLPQVSASFQWLVTGATGLATTYLLCSRAPFTQTMTLLGARSSDAPSLQTLSKPLEVAQAILQDLHQASARVAQSPGNLADSFVLDMNAWASLRFVYQIV